VLATEPSFLVRKIEPVFKDSGEPGEPHTDSMPRGWTIGSACLWTTFQDSPSRRKTVVTRNETGTNPLASPTLTRDLSTSTM
jgi:hypothetical protein